MQALTGIIILLFVNVLLSQAHLESEKTEESLKRHVCPPRKYWDAKKQACICHRQYRCFPVGAVFNPRTCTYSACPVKVCEAGKTFNQEKCACECSQQPKEGCGKGHYWDAKSCACKKLEPICAIVNPEAEEICTYQHSTPVCTPSPYRTIDGSCNNKKHPLWGTPFSISDRLLPAQYGDGVSSFQKSVTGTELPSPRYISKALFGDVSVPDPEYTIIMMQFGQFMAHDMSYGLDSDDHKEPCCTGAVGKFKSTDQCFAIKVPPNDPVYPADMECLDFIRNSNTGEIGCPATDKDKAVAQLNSVTSYLDLSLVYGLNDEQAKSLRTMKGGKLITNTRDGYDWPPQDPDALKHCFVDTPEETCYLGGDERLNQSPHLTIMHILYIREHNRIANELSKINPHWDDEKLFQEARRINIAQYQYVSYYEWLTIFLGDDNMKRLKMIYDFTDDKYVNDYDSSVNVVTYNEHANAAFRFFHTQIEGHLNLVSESRQTLSTVALSDHLNSPGYTEKKFDDFTRGMVYQQSQLTDSNYDKEIRDFLFKHKEKFGNDLRAIDIQRGRDHGVARYNDFREYCGLKRAHHWSDYEDLIPANDVDKLKQVYKSFEDVEFTVGAMLENQIDNTTLAGPTLLCVFNKQFYVTRVGDRYWFESGDPEVAFSRRQLAEIKKSSFSRLVCDNTRIETIQPKSFDVADNDTNVIVPCSKIPIVDLKLWKE